MSSQGSSVKNELGVEPTDWRLCRARAVTVIALRTPSPRPVTSARKVRDRLHHKECGLFCDVACP